MKLQMLAVDKNIEVSQREQAAWKNEGVDTIRVDTMLEAIEQIKKTVFLLIVINADNVDFKPFLNEMSRITNTFIFVITSDFNANDQKDAVNLGADLYVQFLTDSEQNVTSALTYIKSFNNRKKRDEENKYPIIYHDLIIFSVVRQVFIRGVNIKLTKKEYAIVHYLAQNHDNIVTYKMIYDHVWDDSNDGMAADLIHKHMHRICSKFMEAVGFKGYIENVSGVGYRISSLSMKNEKS